MKQADTKQNRIQIGYLIFNYNFHILNFILFYLKSFLFLIADFKLPMPNNAINPSNALSKEAHFYN